jgi:hypothetical protein
MSKLRLGLLVTTAMAVIAAIAGGCSKSTPTAPGQGTPTDRRLMMFGFQDQEIPSFFLADPKTPGDFSDDVLIGVELVSFGDTNSSVLEIVDGTQSNAFRPYSRQAGEEFRPATDFDFTPFDKQIDRGADIAWIVHPAGEKNHSEYMATGVLNGTITTTSPYTNTVVPWGPTEGGLALNIDRIQADSVLTLAFEPDPRALFYVVELSLFDLVNRRDYLHRGSLPLPIAYPHNLSFWFNVPPGYESSIRIPLYAVPFQKVFPRSIVARVSAIDASGKVVSRSPSDYVFSAQGSDATDNFYVLDPCGGFIMTANPYPKGYGLTAGTTAGVSADAASALPFVTNEEVSRMVAGHAGLATRERVVMPRFPDQVSPSLPSLELPVPVHKLPPGILPPAK